jgi:Ulp1 family protease
MTYIDGMFSELKCITVFSTVITWLEFVNYITNSTYSVYFSEWNYFYANNTQQPNFYDCGLYLLRGFQSYISNKPMNWEPETFSEYRKIVFECLVFTFN